MAKSPLDPKMIFDHAQKFQLTQELLRAAAPANIADRAILQEYVSTHGDPILVLSAFASELFLKCLLAIERKPTSSRTHDLHLLFLKLSPGLQSRITVLWDHVVWDQVARESFIYAQETLGATIPRDLISALKFGANTFVDLRYVYEKPRNINNIIIDLPLVLQRAIYEIYPNWRPNRIQPTSPTR